ncbi:MAG: acetyl-CoA C-acetyltransferase [Rickettsiaceae bacterium]|nr:acetyl-CoA C-acetyltransferase [Rickettsiaceae bacterium]
MKEVYITHAKRTAIGNFMGGLSTVPSVKLAEQVLRNLIDSSKIDPAEISEVIMGHVLTGGLGQNTARQASINSGIPKEIPATTINKVCGSGLKSVALAASSIICGDADLVLAGGQENMSLSTHCSYMRSGTRMGNASLVDMMIYDGLTDIFSSTHMGITAENIAKQFNISRSQQDELSYLSHQKAYKAQQEGKFIEEIVPIEVQLRKETIVMNKDEFIKGDTTVETLSKLRPAFDKEGTVTAGNASGINDGAAAVIVASKEAVLKHNLIPIARIVSYASAGVDPSIMGTGPVPASKKALTKAGWNISDLDLIEANEAFASQSCYVNNAMGWDISKVNVNGGAIALGHPIGASGTRILVTLLHEMKRRKSKKALATLCIGGGMGIAMCLEGL